MVGWGNNSFGQTTIPAGLSNVTAIAGGGDHSLALVLTDTTDTIAPTAAPTQSPAANSADWNNSNVTITWNWSDAETGIDTANCTTSSISSGEGTIELSATCKDNAGNEGSAEYTVKVDKTAPSITINTPTATAYLLNQVVAADYSCSDGGLGLASCVGTVAGSANINTASAGNKTFTVNAKDNVNNASNLAVSYQVKYNFVGFASPVDNKGVLNTAKAGQSIPLKWQLLDAGGAPVTNLTSVQVSVISLSCSTGATPDALEEYATGSSGLQNLGNGYYQFNWSTPKSYAGSCKTMRLDLGEGSFRTADFQFK